MASDASTIDPLWTDGGPFVVLEQTKIPQWRGALGGHLLGDDSESDYAVLCECISDYPGIVASQSGVFAFPILTSFLNIEIRRGNDYTIIAPGVYDQNGTEFICELYAGRLETKSKVYCLSIDFQKFPLAIFDATHDGACVDASQCAALKPLGKGEHHLFECTTEFDQMPITYWVLTRSRG